MSASFGDSHGLELTGSFGKCIEGLLESTKCSWCKRRASYKFEKIPAISKVQLDATA